MKILLAKLRNPALVIIGVVFLMPLFSTPVQAIRAQEAIAPVAFVAQTESDSPEIGTSDVDCQSESALSGRIGLFFSALCAVIDGLFNALNWLYRVVIIDLLIIQIPAENPNGSQTALYTIWNNFRILANIAFVGVFLLAVIGQSFSWFLTPYELKKILPRLFIGVIAIQLSWYFSNFIIDIFNILGAGIHGLMLAPLGDTEVGAVLDFQGATGNARAISALIAGATSVVIASTSVGAISGMVPVLFVLVLGVIAAFITLLLRQTLIFLLLVTSPLAFVAWVLPNTSNVFSTWWSFFSKALLMYPLIIMLITGGQFFAGLVNLDSQQNGGVSVTDSILSIIAIFAPFILIPTTFRFAGGAIATISGNMDGMTKRLDKKLFGDERLPGTFRYNRKKNMERRKATRTINNYGRLDKIGINKDGKETSPRARKAAVRAARIASTFGANAFERAAKLQREAYDAVRERVSNGRDEGLFELVSGTGAHPISNDPLSPEAVAEAERMGFNGDFKDEFAVEAAVNYTISKGVPGNQVHKVREAFMNNPKLNFSEEKRAKIWDRAVNQDSVVAVHPDQRYRHATGPNAGEMIQDNHLQNEYLKEMNERFNQRQTSQFQESAFLGIGDVMDNALQLRVGAEEAARTAGDVNRWREQLSEVDLALVDNAQLTYNGVLGRRESGPEASNERVRQLREQHAWVNNDIVSQSGGQGQQGGGNGA